MPRYARKTDPATSHEAAASTTEEHLSRLEAMVYAVLKEFDGTDEAVVNRIVSGGYPASPQGIRTARVRLERKGLIEEVGLAVTRFGRKTRIWGIPLESEK